jgi:hypothetical protein
VPDSDPFHGFGITMCSSGSLPDLGKILRCAELIHVIFAWWIPSSGFAVTPCTVHHLIRVEGLHGGDTK